MKTNNSTHSFKGIEAAGFIIIACFIAAICIYHSYSATRPTL